MLAVMLLPCTLLLIFVMMTKLLDALSAGPSTGAAAYVVVAALIGTPLLWFYILRRDATNAAERRARAANEGGAAVTMNQRLRPSAPTVADMEFRSASGTSTRN